MTEAFVVRELWKGSLWSATPHRLVARDGGGFVTYCAPGTPWLAPTSGEVVSLSRGEQQLALMTSGDWDLVAEETTMATLEYIRLGSWVRVKVGWSADFGEFRGWYVNFEMPSVATVLGVDTMDLVLDLVVAPSGKPAWKDRNDFERAIDARLFPTRLRERLERAARAVLVEISSGRGRFDPAVETWRPDPKWASLPLPRDDVLDGPSALESFGA